MLLKKLHKLKKLFNFVIFSEHVHMLGECLDRIARRSLEGLSLEFYAEVILTLENELKQAEKA